MTNKELEKKVLELEQKVSELLGKQDKKTYEFKIGDRVQFKSWEELEAEYPEHREGMRVQKNGLIFNAHMKPLCNTYATIAEFDKYRGNRVILTDFTANKEHTGWAFSTEMLKPAVNEPKSWKFTDNEKDILRRIKLKYKFISRDKCGDLWLYENKPTKDIRYWTVGKGSYEGNSLNLNVFDVKFDSIKWEDDEPCEFGKFI